MNERYPRDFVYENTVKIMEHSTQRLRLPLNDSSDTVGTYSF